MLNSVTNIEISRNAPVYYLHFNNRCTKTPGISDWRWTSWLVEDQHIMTLGHITVYVLHRVPCNKNYVNNNYTKINFVIKILSLD